MTQITQNDKEFLKQNENKERIISKIEESVSQNSKLSQQISHEQSKTGKDLKSIIRDTIEPLFEKVTGEGIELLEDAIHSTISIALKGNIFAGVVLSIYEVATHEINNILEKKFSHMNIEKNQ